MPSKAKNESDLDILKIYLSNIILRLKNLVIIYITLETPGGIFVNSPTLFYQRLVMIEWNSLTRHVNDNSTVSIFSLFILHTVRQWYATGNCRMPITHTHLYIHAMDMLK